MFIDPIYFLALQRDKDRQLRAATGKCVRLEEENKSLKKELADAKSRDLILEATAEASVLVLDDTMHDEDDDISSLKARLVSALARNIKLQNELKSAQEDLFNNTERYTRDTDQYQLDQAEIGRLKCIIEQLHKQQREAEEQSSLLAADKTIPHEKIALEQQIRDAEENLLELQNLIARDDDMDFDLDIALREDFQRQKDGANAKIESKLPQILL
uniref:Uncharacterized protein n=1 Tax=Panagrolaimus davidi TaxID=227884 RepID=A0A914QLT9_9BILA